MTYTVAVTARDSGGHTAVRDVAVVEYPRLGATGTPQDTASTFAAFPASAYFRDFGDDGGDPDALTELTAHGTGKLALAPAAALPHVSWKDDVEALEPWLTAAPAGKRYLLSFHHEPMGNIAPAAYRQAGARLTQILAGHPNRRVIAGHGPILTRYWLDQGGGDPGDYAYPGMTFMGCDCYNGASTFYRTGPQMFGPGIAAARRYGVPWLVGEYGIERIPTDPTGAGRAQTMRDHIGWIRRQGDCLAVGWWNIGGDRITGVEPESSTWRALSLQ